MCGISGAYHLNREPVEKNIVQTMTDLLSHRGPDDGGVYHNYNVGLGNRRLKIIDLSYAGHQPMSNENNSEKGKLGSDLILVFNGEIYNYKQLRDNLIEKGHVFTSFTDTETILHLYEDIEEDCVEKLEGMFAFAIWDKTKDSLLIARDRLGEKPLLYTINNNVFYFASEINPLLNIPDISLEMNGTAIRQYFNFFHVTQPESMFEKIKKLPPASTIRISKNSIDIKQYWKPSYYPKWNGSEEEIAVELREHIDASVKSRMMSDVPLGTMLSGGIDSTLISALTKRHTNVTLRTFSAFYEDENGRDLDWEFAQLASKNLDVEHHNVFYNADDLISLLGTAVRNYGEPHADIASLVSMYLSRFMKEHVTVVLSGNGGDELFGGYNTYRKVSRISSPLIQSMLKVFPYFPWNIIRRLSQKNGWMLGGNTAMLMYLLALKPKDRLNYSIATGDEWLTGNLFNSDFQKINDDDICKPFKEIFSKANTDNFLDSWLFTDLMGRMQEYTVIQPDISGMAYGLEIRAPFLDHKIVEYAAKIPAGLKVKNYKTTKYILRLAAEGIIPDEITFRKKKTGFSGVTYAQLIKLSRSKWKSLFNDSLFNGTLQKTGIFNNSFIEKSWKLLINRTDTNDDTVRLFQVIWSLILFEHWHREVVLNRKNIHS